IAISLRHYWPEPWNGAGDFSAQQQAEDVASFIQQLGAGKVHLVGHSRGGYIALQLARAHPDLLRDLVLAEPALLLPGLVEGAKGSHATHLALDALEKCFPDQRHMIIPGAVHTMNRSHPDAFNQAVQEFAAQR